MVNLKYLQKLLFLLVMGFSISVVCACSDNDDDDEPVQAPQISEETQTPTSLKYYVKYEIDVEYTDSYSYDSYDYKLSCDYTDSFGGEKNFTKIAENGKSLHWEGVYGPFEKGDVVSFEYRSYRYGYSSSYFYGEHQARIYMQEGDEGTFAIKKEGTGSSGSLTYTIGEGGGSNSLLAQTNY